VNRASLKQIAAILALASVALAATPEFAWRQAVPGYRFHFPRDHFDHPDFRTEWWYYTGNVWDREGRRFGFELVFFRQGERRGTDANPSAWRVDDLYLAHAALTDVSGKRFVYRERLNRAGPGIAGISFSDGRVWNGNWSVQWTGVRQTLLATTPDFRLRLQLSPVKPAILQGENGLSQKAEGRGKASYYVSFPRLAVSGEIVAGGRTRQASGSAWMDHEWFTHQLAAGEIGWDWFSVQLDNHTELMLFELRRKDGTIDPYSSGTFIDAAGAAHHLDAQAMRLTPLEKWNLYPIHWRIEVPSLHLQLDCRAVIPNQELIAKQGGTAYWEGAVDYSGSQTGTGYLEMTGYRKPVEF
jgi:predicted secreted hydrolase